MNEKQQEIIERIKKQRNYDTSCTINISKDTDDLIVNVARSLKIDYEEAAEYLIELGQAAHYEM